MKNTGCSFTLGESQLICGAVGNINIYLLNYEFSGSRAEEAGYQHTLSARLLSYVIKAETGKSMAELTVSKSEKGKPYIKDFPLKFNLSHTTGLVAAACGKGEVGLDAQRIGTFPERVARRVCTPWEYRRLVSSPDPAGEFYSLWTFKEAFVKWLGAGLSYPLNRATLDEGRSVLSVYPGLKIFSLNDGQYAVTAVEEGGCEGNFIKLGPWPIMES